MRWPVPLKVFLAGDKLYKPLILKYLQSDQDRPPEIEIECSDDPEMAKRMILEGFLPDLLITRTRLKQQNDLGFSLVVWAREHVPATKIIVMSSHPDSEAKAREVGANAFWYTSGNSFEELVGIIKGIFKK